MTKKCITCKKEKELSEFRPQRKQTDARYALGYFVLNFNVCKKCSHEKRMTLLFKKKQEWIDYKGGECTSCGYDKCNAALEFHHENSVEKDEKLSKGWRFRSFKNVKGELDKCVLLCANCHREAHVKNGDWYK